MTNEQIKEISEEVIKKIEVVTELAKENPRAKEILDDLYFEAKNIFDIALSKNQLVTEKEQENMNLKKEVEFLKSNLEFAMGKDVSENLEVLEKQARVDMATEVKEEESKEENAEVVDQEEIYGLKGKYRKVSSDVDELKFIFKDADVRKKLDDVALDTLHVVNRSYEHWDSVHKIEVENIKLKDAVGRLQVSLDYAMGKTPSEDIYDNAAEEMNTELKGRLFG